MACQSNNLFVPSNEGFFYQYVNLVTECIDNYDKTKHEFLNHFYGIRRTVSMMKLMNTKQWKDEPIINYIYG